MRTIGVGPLALGRIRTGGTLGGTRLCGISPQENIGGLTISSSSFIASSFALLATLRRVFGRATLPEGPLTGISAPSLAERNVVWLEHLYLEMDEFMEWAAAGKIE